MYVLQHNLFADVSFDILEHSIIQIFVRVSKSVCDFYIVLFYSILFNFLFKIFFFLRLFTFGHWMDFLLKRISLDKKDSI